MPQINWIIRAVYIPLAATAFVSGVALVWRAGLSFAPPYYVLRSHQLMLVMVALARLYRPDYNSAP